MGANPRVLTLGDMVYARDAQPGDILVLDENLSPTWTNLDELAERIAAALVKTSAKAPKRAKS